MSSAGFVTEHGRAVAEAAGRIDGRVLRTPLLSPLEMPGVLLKPECLQPTGSFKVRGAFNAVLSLLEEQPGAPGVVTVSSGNHGQALAYAARSLGLPAVVVMPEKASPVKRAAVQRLGARIVDDGVTTDNREARFTEVIAETGFVPVHPFDNWAVIHGQGTTGLEIAEQAADVATVAVPLGGGGLVSGIAIALAHLGSGVRVIGVEPEAADDARRSLAAGHVVSRQADATIADGALANHIGDRPAEVLLSEHLIDDVVTVTDDELIATLPRIWAETRLLVEPTGALALTAVLLGRVPGTPGTVVAVVSGANTDPTLVVSTLGSHQS